MFKRQSAVRTKSKVKRRVIDPGKRMLIGQVLIGTMLFSVLGLCIAGVWYGTRVESLTIKQVSATGGETINHDKVIDAVQVVLEGTYLGLIPRRFAWTYPETEIYAALSGISRLKDPVVKRISGTELRVTFDEYVPYALWCTGRTEGECVLIDESGYAFTQAPNLKGGALIRYRTLGTEPMVGTSITAKESLATIAEFIALVHADGKFDIVAVETDSVGDVFYIVAGGGEFKAALRDPAPVVYDNLRTILGSKEFSAIAPGNFQYIDLRFGSKVFVNDQEIGAASSTATSSISTPDTTATTTPQ